MYIMFSTPLTCCSMGAATASATSCALAPGYVQVTCTVGGVILGNCDNGSVKYATTPASTVRMDSTEAKIGRSMKNREITAIPGVRNQGLGVRDQESGLKSVGW